MTKTTRLWDSATGKEIRRLEGNSQASIIAFSPDGRTVLTGSHDLTARLWEVATGKEIRRLEGHSGPILALALSPDGRYALTSGFDKTTRLWDSATGKEIRRLEGNSQASIIAFSPDGRPC